MSKEKATCQKMGYDSSAAESVEQINFVQNNQGMRQKENFYKNPQHPLGQAAPPSYANSQRVAQKSNLEILIETYFSNQIGLLNDSLSKLTSMVDSIFSHNKILETQISQLTHKHTCRFFCDGNRGR